MKKTIVVIGGSGGIGGAVARRFQKYGWDVVLLLRSLTKGSVKELIALPGVKAYLCDPENQDQVSDLFSNLKKEGVRVNLVFHAAGTFLWDDGFPGAKMEALEVEQVLIAANLTTKETVISALRQSYGDELSNIKQYLVSSHAVDFAPDSPYRTGPFKEEGYVKITKKVCILGSDLVDEGIWGEITVLKPGLINTQMAQNAFTEERIGFVDWGTIQTPEEYAETVFPEVFFKSGQ